MFVPGIPEFWEAVEKDGDGPVGRAGGDGVEFDRAVVKSHFFENGWHRGRVYP